MAPRFETRGTKVYFCEYEVGHGSTAMEASAFRDRANDHLDQHYTPRAVKPAAARAWRCGACVGIGLRYTNASGHDELAPQLFESMQRSNDFQWLDSEPEIEVTAADRELAEKILRLAFGVVVEQNKVEAAKLISHYRHQQ